MDPETLSKFKRLGRGVTFADTVVLRQPELISIGDNVTFYHGVYLQPTDEEMVIGSRCHFAPYAVLYGPLEIGDKCAVAAHVVFASVAHAQEPVETAFVDLRRVSGKIVLEENVWIGANAVILPGIRIGTGSIIGAGAVVTHDVEPWSVMGGVPARVIRRRK